MRWHKKSTANTLHYTSHYTIGGLIIYFSLAKWHLPSTIELSIMSDA